MVRRLNNHANNLHYLVSLKKIREAYQEFDEATVASDIIQKAEKIEEHLKILIEAREYQQEKENIEEQELLYSAKDYLPTMRDNVFFHNYKIYLARGFEEVKQKFQEMLDKRKEIQPEIDRAKEELENLIITTDSSPSPVSNIQLQNKPPITNIQPQVPQNQPPVTNMQPQNRTPIVQPPIINIPPPKPQKDPIQKPQDDSVQKKTLFTPEKIIGVSLIAIFVAGTISYFSKAPEKKKQRAPHKVGLSRKRFH